MFQRSRLPVKTSSSQLRVGTGYHGAHAAKKAKKRRVRSIYEEQAKHVSILQAISGRDGALGSTLLVSRGEGQL